MDLKDEDMVITLIHNKPIGGCPAKEPKGVWIYHKPTGISVSSSVHNSVHKNRRSAELELADKIKNIESVNKIKELEQQNTELMAQVNELRGSLILNCGNWKAIEPTIKRTQEQSLAEHDAELFENAETPKYAKAGCAGEFQFTIENAQVCPSCWHQKDDDCELCLGQTDENGYSDLTVSVPWDIQKEIWKRINKIYAEQLRKGEK